MGDFKRVSKVLVEEQGEEMHYVKAPNLKAGKNIPPDGPEAVGDARYVDPRALLAGNLRLRRYRSLGHSPLMRRENGSWTAPGMGPCL